MALSLGLVVNSMSERCTWQPLSLSGDETFLRCELAAGHAEPHRISVPVTSSPRVPVVGPETEPCPSCGCPGDQYDGHVCEEYVAADGSSDARTLTQTCVILWNGCAYGPFASEPWARTWIEQHVPGIQEPRYVVAPLDSVPLSDKPIPPEDVARAREFVREQGWHTVEVEKNSPRTPLEVGMDEEAGGG